VVKDKNFGKMLRELREDKGITLDLLCLGLCDVGKLSRIENGKVEAEKLLRDRLLDRLGVAEENYENFLYYSEYKGWKERQDIVHGMIQGRYEEVKKLLETYRDSHSMENALELQFYLSILVQIRRIEGATKEEVRNLFEQALKLTVPEDAFQEPWGMLLSVEELNFLLEYTFYNRENYALSWYERMLLYVEQLQLEPLLKAKLYPKLVFYFHQIWQERGMENKTEISKMLRLCNKAIEILQRGNRMFFLWELLQIKEQLLQRLIEENGDKGENAVKQLKEWKQTCINWYTTLSEVYEEYNVSKATKDFCYVYVDREAHCIGDVIRIRRKMFGMTMQQLADGICSERTISRLERNETEPHRDIVRELFGRLNMSGEFCRKELVSERPEVLQIFSEAKEKSGKREYDASDRILEQIESKVSFEIPGNRQAIQRLKLTNEWHRKRANKEELDRKYFVERLKEILGDTIPYETAVLSDEKYLTQNEVSCLQNIMVSIDWKYQEMEQCVTALYEWYEKYRCLEECFDMYEFVMGAIASNLGNKGEYDSSDQIGIKILNYELIYRRIGRLYREKYSLLWNDVQRVKNQHPARRGADTKKELLKCIYLCEVCDVQYQLSFLRKALEEGIK